MACCRRAGPLAPERDGALHSRLIAACEHTNQILHATLLAVKIQRSCLAYQPGNSQTSLQELDVRLSQSSLAGSSVYSGGVVGTDRCPWTFSAHSKPCQIGFTFHRERC